MSGGHHGAGQLPQPLSRGRVERILGDAHRFEVRPQFLRVDDWGLGAVLEVVAGDTLDQWITWLFRFESTRIEL